MYVLKLFKEIKQYVQLPTPLGFGDTASYTHYSHTHIHIPLRNVMKVFVKKMLVYRALSIALHVLLML